jgi:hypothetical protein
LDDGPMMIDDHSCLVTNTLEDKNDTLVVYDNALICESPILCLNSPDYTIEEKYACVENYLYDLQLSYAYENPCCNHDTMIEKGTSNYLE